MTDKEQVDQLVKELGDADQLNGRLIRKLSDIENLLSDTSDEGCCDKACPEDLVLQIKAILDREV